MKLAYLAFSETGYELAWKLADALGGEAFRSGRPDETGKVLSLNEWTASHFAACDGIVFVGAAGIAVRAIAPFVRDKASDPAVIVIDELALHVIPILSGHLGGANDLAREISRITGSDCVITTATDIHGIFAVDEWARKQHCLLLEREKIVSISSRLLNGSGIAVYSPWKIRGEPPEGVSLAAPEDADIVMDIRDAGLTGKALHLIPGICVLGVGCRKGTPAQTLESQFADFMAEAGIMPESIRAVSTIDIKNNEPGLIEFCARHGWPLITFTSDELRNVSGDFTASEFVSSVTGVDNVCERSAVLAAGGNTQEHLPGSLLQKKFAGNGVTLALAAADYEPDWECNI
ncbi:MAG: cobalt-precorrin 5A hydrolase [Bacillota bacterium]|nr:cobalt-precorrin 5A hydrolase [Bacillota bacterium]